ncbi:MAG: PEGA domain-containing protein [Candidatus Omnitrophica bacterium]|nr:PEGA domain-containing protein [Candidatus Omnitrophota bacterium]
MKARNINAGVLSSVVRGRQGLAVKGLLLTVFCVLAAGCGSALRVYSNPLDANIYVNGVDTGKKTPATIGVRSLHVGRSYISVEKEGYKTTTQKQLVDVGVSVGNIIWSWWPPVLIKNLCSNYWKTINYPSDEHLPEFQLEKVAEPVPTSNNVVAPVK